MEVHYENQLQRQVASNQVLVIVKDCCSISLPTMEWREWEDLYCRHIHRKIQWEVDGVRQRDASQKTRLPRVPVTRHLDVALNVPNYCCVEEVAGPKYSRLLPCHCAIVEVEPLD